MSDSLLFMMGLYEARFPTDRDYATNHMWAERRGEKIRFGFSNYAVRLLQDVYFLEWSVEPGTLLKEGQPIGFIESKKAESDLFAPVSGKLTTLNETLLSDPSAINVATHEAGWLFEMVGAGDSLLSAEAYVEHLIDVWKVTEKTIKGQLNA